MLARVSAAFRHALPRSTRLPDAVVQPIVSAPTDPMWLALEQIDAFNIAEGTASHTTERMRRELMFFALDNNRGGPIVEVGTMNGGMTAMFGHIAKMTNRRCIAIDINPIQVARTKETCERHGVGDAIELFCGSLQDYVASHAWRAPDLIFIDSSHHYLTTLDELRALHGIAGPPPLALAFHDFNYRIDGHLPGQCADPVAVDHAVNDFYSREYAGARPIMKRVGALTGDGMQATPANPGSVQHDYMEWHGSEGMLLVFPQ